jgi:hypothetical protein
LIFLIWLENCKNGIAIARKVFSQNAGEGRNMVYAFVCMVANADRTGGGDVHGFTQTPHPQLVGVSFSSDWDSDFPMAS